MIALTSMFMYVDVVKFDLKPKGEDETSIIDETSTVLMKLVLLLVLRKTHLFRTYGSKTSTCTHQKIRKCMSLGNR